MLEILFGNKNTEKTYLRSVQQFCQFLVINNKVRSLRLTEQQMSEMLDKPDQTTLIGRRD
jgi:hypothetical protein